MIIRHIYPQLDMGVLPLDPKNSALSGIANNTFQLAIHQASRGHEVEIFCPIPAKKYQQKKIDGVDIHWIPIWNRWRFFGYDYRYLLPLYLFTRKSRNVDISHVHANPFHIIRERTRAVIFHYHGPAVSSSIMYGRMISKADSIICVSDHIREQVKSTINYPPQKIFTIYNGINSTSLEVDRIKIKAEFGIDEDTFVVLWAGRISPEKGLIFLVDAISKIIKKGFSKIVLLVAGSAKLGASPGNGDAYFQKNYPELFTYEKSVLEMSKGLPIKFLGDINFPLMAKFYSLGDVFVCSSVYNEPFGRVLTEAIVSGVPVIASNVGGIPEIVKHNENGILVPPADSNILAESIISMMTDNNLRSKMSHAAKEIIQRMDWSIITGQIDRLYRSVLDK